MVPRTVNALKDFMGIFAKIPEIDHVTTKDTIETALTRVFEDWAEDYADKIDYHT